jgi:hypothetical protein
VWSAGWKRWHVANVGNIAVVLGEHLDSDVVSGVRGCGWYDEGSVEMASGSRRMFTFLRERAFRCGEINDTANVKDVWDVCEHGRDLTACEGGERQGDVVELDMGACM